MVTALASLFCCSRTLHKGPHRFVWRHAAVQDGIYLRGYGHFDVVICCQGERGNRATDAFGHFAVHIRENFGQLFGDTLLITR